MNNPRFLENIPRSYRLLEAVPLRDVPTVELGEGPVWIPEERRLLWLDIEGKALLTLRWNGTTASEIERFSLPEKVGCVVPERPGHFLLAAQNGILGPASLQTLENPGGLARLPVLAHPGADRPTNRYNDGKCSPDGRFWVGSLNMDKRPHEAALYCLERRADGTLATRAILRGATNSNGLAWSPDTRTFYWIDTPTRRIEAFDYDTQRGTLTNRRTVIVFPPEPARPELVRPEPVDASERPETAPGRPDGMTIDREGNLWIAHWAGGRVSRWNPHTGERLAEARLPVSRVTSVTFGGENLDTLFVTTARHGMSAEQRAREPDAGRLFIVQTDSRGLPVDRFRCVP